jgi:hypothetical protein
MGEISVIGQATFARLEIVPEIQSESGALDIGKRPLIWLSVCCLDAPFVAIAWQWLFADVFSVPLPAANTAALFFTAWFIYLIDRFADSVSLRGNFPKSIRQQVCFNHRKLWMALILLVGIADAGIIFDRLDRPTMVRGLILGTVALCYLTLNWALDRTWEIVPIKELCIGFVFAAGSVLVGLPSLADAGSTIAFVTAAGLFAMLCSLNCISIATWEGNLDVEQGKHSIATFSPRAKYYARALLIFTVSISVSLVCFRVLDAALSTRLAISSVLLFLLHLVPVTRDERTALADLVLLTPLGCFLIKKLL